MNAVAICLAVGATPIGTVGSLDKVTMPRCTLNPIGLHTVYSPPSPCAFVLHVIDPAGFHAAWGTPSCGVAVSLTSQWEPHVKSTATCQKSKAQPHVKSTATCQKHSHMSKGQPHVKRTATQVT